MAEKMPMTKKGYIKLQDELDRLRKEARPANIRAIAEARGHGDLSENAEYHAAKEEQGHIEGRIQEIQGKLALANVIDTSKLSNEKVVFGATVTLLDMDSEEEKRYTLVGTDEADLKDGKISTISPVGKALLGHKVGDTVTVRVPAGTVDYEIQDICFED
ncbi:MAG: transcription elongation factor GreA [Nitrospirae bacterium]|nr:transcription elongation factor GreA [Nitrospirota bacterium]MBI5695832.1 transcription elongation factor GreA [Nitrospirota bacterium]